MAGGTKIYGPLVSPDPSDKFYHVDANKIKGGKQIRNTIAEMEAIDMEIRREGQECDVISLNKTYKLIGGIENSNWQEVIQSNDVSFSIKTVEENSSNILNPNNITDDVFVGTNGGIFPSTPLGSYSLFVGVWGNETDLICSKDGVAQNIWTVAQFDVNGNFINGSYKGTNVSGSVSKVANAVTFKITIKNTTTPVNQINFGKEILPYEPYYPTIITLKKVGDKDANGNEVTFKPDLTDTDLLNRTLGFSLKRFELKSSNILNPTLLIPDFFINSSGNLSASSPAGSYSVFVGTWGTATNLVAAKDGVPTTIFSIAQFDINGNFIAGSYQGTTISGAISKATNAVVFKLTIRNSAAPINQLNFSSSVLAYEPYFDTIIGYKKIADKDGNGNKVTFKADLTDPDLLAMIGASNSAKTTESIVSPDKIYCLCNDLGKTTNNGFQTNNYSSVLYSDHFFNFATRKKALFRSTKSDKLPVFAPVATDNSVYNQGSDVLTRTITDVLEGDIADTPISFSGISTLLSAVANKLVRVLKMGDSTVNGTGSFYPANVTLNNPAQAWSYIKKLNLMYKAQNGGVGFDCVMIGKQSIRNFVYNGQNYRACAEGRGGWKVDDYITKEVSTNNYTNFFYDANQTGNVKFSLQSYLQKYKTLADDGITRLTVGSTAGSLVSSSDINNYDVCTPTHVVIQLGFNDLAADYQTNLPLLIAKIKEEFPNMIIIISVIDAAGTYFPELYSNTFNAAGIDLLGDALHAKMWGLINFVKSQENTTNRVYACLNYFIQPTAWGVTTRDINYPESIANPVFMMQQEHGAGSNYHPNTYAHAAWAYHLDSLIKYTSYLYL